MDAPSCGARSAFRVISSSSYFVVTLRRWASLTCSLQHGQRVHREPKQLLSDLGFTMKDIAEGHLCCGSAGTYNILQPEIAARLRDRKIENIEKLQPDVIAAGNIGCITQIAAGTAIPVVHPVELIDRATRGPVPQGLQGRVDVGA